MGQALPRPLISQRGIRKAIANHPGAGFQHGADGPHHMFPTRSKMQHGFGQTVPGTGREQQITNTLCPRRAARLTRAQNRHARRRKRRRNAPRLGRFSRALAAFKRDEIAACHQHFRRRRPSARLPPECAAKGQVFQHPPQPPEARKVSAPPALPPAIRQWSARA